MAPYIKELLDNLGNLSTHFKPILPCFSHKLGKSITPARTCSISGLKSRVLKFTFLSLKNDGKKWSRLFILKFTVPFQSSCCPMQKYLPRMTELAWQLSMYLWRGWVNFKINSWPLFTIIFKLKNNNFKTRDFSPLIERVLAGVDRLANEINQSH